MNARLIPMAGLLALLAACQAPPTPPEAYTESTTDEAVQPATFERYGTLTVAAGTEEKPLDMRLWYARPDQVTPNTPVASNTNGAEEEVPTGR